MKVSVTTTKKKERKLQETDMHQLAKSTEVDKAPGPCVFTVFQISSNKLLLTSKPTLTPFTSIHIAPNFKYEFIVVFC